MTVRDRTVSTGGRGPTLVSIQYLRGLAAVAVVVEHTHWTGSHLGAAGVDVFFAISGFIMVHVSLRETAAWTFFRARLIRVAPMYWLCTLLAAAIFGADKLHLIHSLAFWPGPENHAFPVIYAGWTLNFEMFFYAIFAAALFLPFGWRSSSVVLALIFLVAAQVMWPGTQPFDSDYINPILLEFIGGILLAEAWRRNCLPGLLGSLALTALESVRNHPVALPSLRTISLIDASNT